MDDLLEQQTTVDFVVESEKHLDIAARMSTAFPVAKRKIIAAMFDALEAKMTEISGAGWEIYNPREELASANYPGFYIQRASWGDLYLNLENQVRERSTVVGIWREKKPSASTLDDALAEAFGKVGLPGQRNRWWAWYKVLPPEYGNWSSAATLATMHFRQKEVVDFFVAEILRVREVAMPIIEA